MKKILLLSFVFCAFFFMTSCGGDDACDQDAWIGSYTLTSQAECELDDNTSVTADPSLIIAAGSSDDKLDIAGIDVAINEENCSVTALFVTLVLDGDKITSDFGEGCVFTYERN